MISTCSQLRGKGRADLRGRWTEAAMLTFVLAVVTFFVSGIGSAIDIAVFGPGKLGLTTGAGALFLLSSNTTNCFSFLASLLLLPMGWGYTVAFLGNRRAGSDDPFGPGNLFSGYRDFCRVFGTMLIVALFEFLFYMLLIIPGIWMEMRLAMVPYILRDYPELSYNKALRLSADMMQGHKWKLFCLELSFLGWILLCIPTLGIGLLWLSPYMYQTMANFYEEVKAEYEGTQEECAFTI